MANGGGEDICIARTDEGLRKGGLSLRGVNVESNALFAGTMGLEAMEISDGSSETKLVVVTPETRRDCVLESMDGRDVYELRYGRGSSSFSRSCSCSMLGIGSSAPGRDISELNDVSSS